MPLTTIFTVTPNANNSDANESYRNVCVITGGGQKVQVSLQSLNSGGTWVLTHAGVGIWTGTSADTTATPVELTFNGGQHGFNVAATGQTIVSDEIDLGVSFTLSNRLVVILDWGANSAVYERTTAAANCAVTFASGASYNVASGYTNLGTDTTTADGGLILIQAEAGAAANPPYNPYQNAPQLASILAQKRKSFTGWTINPDRRWRRHKGLLVPNNELIKKAA